MVRNGNLHSGDRKIPVAVEKLLCIPRSGASLKAGYNVEIENENDVLFGVEMNLSLQSGYSDDSYIKIPGRTLSDSHLASSGEEHDVSEVVLTVGWMPLKVKISFSSPSKLWWFPIETVSLSEGGIEKNYQNTCIVPLWKINNVNGKFNIEIEMAVES